MDWTKVVTEPAGLAGFALALVFGVVSTRQRMPRWWPAVAATLAAVSVAGGLFIAYKTLDTGQKNSASTAASDPARSSEATTRGNCSPAYSGVTVGGTMESTVNCATQATPGSDAGLPK